MTNAASNCCGCTLYSNELTADSIPSGLSVGSGTWTASSDGLRTFSTDAFLSYGAGGASSYKGNQGSFSFHNGEAGDVAAFYFNSGWKLTVTLDDGTGNTGSCQLWNSGTLYNQTPYAGTTGGSIGWCISKAVNPSDTNPLDYHGGVAVVNGLGSNMTVSTLAFSFGTGSQNTGGLTFTDLEVSKADYTNGTGDEVTDPSGLACGSCTCAFNPVFKGDWNTVIGLTFTVTVSGLADDNIPMCGNCPTMNSSYACVYELPPAANAAFSGMYHCTVDLGVSCSSDLFHVAGQVDVILSGGGCGHTYLAVSAFIGADSGDVGFETSAPIDIGFFDPSDLYTANSLISAAVAAGALVGSSTGCTPHTLDASNLSLEIS